MTIQKTAILTRSEWDGKFETFKLVPVTKDCFFSECFYDPTNNCLVVVAKDTREKFVMIPSLNPDGSHKMDNRRKNIVDRVRSTANVEYYMNRNEDIELFLNTVALNADTFDYSRYFNEVINLPPQNLAENAVPETPADIAPDVPAAPAAEEPIAASADIEG